MSAYTTVIGLEVHVQLSTKTKAFCADQNQFGQPPNTNISAVSIALPGTLPVLNEGHVEAGIKIAHALGSQINFENRFDRKNYFYPDLPKGYQITQENLPICKGGQLSFESEGKTKTVRIHQVHMEEDAGKSSHDQYDNYSVVDHNRAGTPLLEIVTEPDLRSGQEVSDFIASLQQLVRYIDISDGNMEEGSLRCDVNVSVMPQGSDTFGERCEVKNVNSKKFAKQAAEFESQRQIKLLEKGEKILKTTLSFDPETGRTSPMRSKEEVNDYRYFPDPDLPPVVLTEKYIREVIDSIEILPWEARKDLEENYELTAYEAEILTRDIEEYSFFKNASGKASAAQVSTILINKILPETGENFRVSELNPENVSALAFLLEQDNINKSSALNVLSEEIILAKSELLNIQKLAEKHNLIQSDNQDFLDAIIDKVLEENQDKLKAFRNGKKGLQGFFMGQVMRLSQGKANPQVLNKKLAKALKGE